MQQLIWSNNFNKYVDQLTHLFTPLLKNAFISSLLVGNLSLNDNDINIYYDKLLKLLYDYYENNKSLFIFDPSSDSSLDLYYKISDSGFVNNDNLSYQYSEIKSKLDYFSNHELSNLNDDEIKFIYKFYLNNFYSKDGCSLEEHNFLQLYKGLIGLSHTNPKEVSKKNTISKNYMREKAKLDIQHVLDFLHTSNDID